MIDVLDKQRQGLDPRLKEIVDREEQDARDFVVCATCSHVIARRSDQIDVNGSFDHRFTNPYGLEFHVGCFSEALGCALSGDRVADALQAVQSQPAAGRHGAGRHQQYLPVLSGQGGNLPLGLVGV